MFHLRLILEEVHNHLHPATGREFLAVTDAQGRVLWTTGPDEAQATAASVGLAPELCGHPRPEE